MKNSAIEWTDHTFNPWIGCTKVSPGCDHCYAEARMDNRLHVVNWGAGQPRKRTSAANWKEPMRWQREAKDFGETYGRRQRVFCSSLADVFDNEVPVQWRRDLFDLIDATPNLDWLLLTKRIGNARRLYAESYLDSARPWPRNVWLGATVVSQEEADRDIPKLLAVPARVRFLSVEPMLGPIDLTLDGLACVSCPRCADSGADPDTGAVENCRRCEWTGKSDEWGIDWVIVGGESGPGARPMHPDWARSLRDQCQAAGVPFLFKQWGEWAEVDGDKPTRTVQVESDIGETLASRCDGFISQAGEFVRSMDDAATDDPYRGMVRIGKKAAGRLLDGRTHDGFPGGAS